MIEISEVRKRLRQAIARARASAAERRAAIDAADHSYQRFLKQVATPVFRMVANALDAEGYPFQVFTPAGGVRLASERAGDDFIEVVLDTSGERPIALGRISRGRGRRLLTEERPIRDGAAIDRLTDDDMLEFLLGAIGPFVER